MIPRFKFIQTNNRNYVIYNMSTNTYSTLDNLRSNTFDSKESLLSFFMDSIEVFNYMNNGNNQYKLISFNVIDILVVQSIDEENNLFINVPNDLFITPIFCN